MWKEWPGSVSLSKLLTWIPLYLFLIGPLWKHVLGWWWNCNNNFKELMHNLQRRIHIFYFVPTESSFGESYKKRFFKHELVSISSCPPGSKLSFRGPTCLCLRLGPSRADLETEIWMPAVYLGSDIWEEGDKSERGWDNRLKFAGAPLRDGVEYASVLSTNAHSSLLKAVLNTLGLTLNTPQLCTWLTQCVCGTREGPRQTHRCFKKPPACLLAIWKMAAIPLHCSLLSYLRVWLVHRAGV